MPDNDHGGGGHPVLSRSNSFEDEVLEAACRAVSAAEEAHRATQSGKLNQKEVSCLTANVLAESRAVLTALQASSKTRKRQSFAEFTTMLGEEMEQEVRDMVNEGIEYGERTLRKAKSLIEDHFNIDEAFRMLGPLHQDPNVARDVHDYFNLVALIPVVILNLTNWKMTYTSFAELFRGVISLPGLWTGHYFGLFWWTTFMYFVADLMFMIFLPHCVRSPGVIVKHHLVTLGYIFVPKLRPRYGWLMGACMIVEVNTWFLIARRSFNKKALHRLLAQVKHDGNSISPSLCGLHCYCGINATSCQAAEGMGQRCGVKIGRAQPKRVSRLVRMRQIIRSGHDQVWDPNPLIDGMA